MRHIRTCCLLLIAPLALTAANLESVPRPVPNASAAGLTLTVRVYELAPEAFPHLPRAIAEATRVYEDAGLRVHWLECPAGARRDPACDAAPGPADILLRILPGQARSELSDALGYALPLEQGRGIHAAVLFGAVQQARHQTTLSTAQVMGHVIAHEIGHLLLGGLSHTRDGLMAANWSHHDFGRISRREMRFDGRQTRRIHNAVRLRMRHAGADAGVSLAAARMPARVIAE